MIDLLLGQFLPYVIAAVAGVGLFLGYGVKKKREGRSQERSQRARDTLKAVKDKRGIEDEVAKDSDDDLRDSISR